MRIILFIILITVGVVWWIGYNAEAPDMIDTGTLQSDIQLKEYEMKHGATRSVKRAMNGNTRVHVEPVPEEIPHQGRVETEEPVRHARSGFAGATDAVRNAVEDLMETAKGFFK